MAAFLLCHYAALTKEQRSLQSAIASAELRINQATWFSFSFWWAEKDLNLRPLLYQSSALTPELPAQTIPTTNCYGSTPLIIACEHCTHQYYLRLKPTWVFAYHE